MQRLIDRYNIPHEIVGIWRQEEGDNLLQVQVEAIENFHLLEGNSLLITAPSSSGKTFIGEVAAINSYLQGKKTIFLVPMKAIAEEKYLEFKRKYQAFGLRIAISTHDRTEFDDSILAGYFDIATIIFEKMNALLTQNQAVLNSCGLLVIDELQLLNDRSRGADLEILLTKIKMIKETDPQSFQFLGLSAVLANLNRFDEWIGAAHCSTQSRPLELHEGVLSADGRVKVRNFIDHREYSETIPGISQIQVPTTAPQNRRETEAFEESILQRLIHLCKYHLNSGKRILIFRKWRPLTRTTAQRLAQTLNLPQATGVIQALAEVENSNSRETLIQCLSGGVAFHNSDLSPEERLAIETDFRKADSRVQVICSTSTLAMGVNLPSPVVIIPDTFKPDPDAEDFHEIPITAAEYKNMAGRAGRTRFMEEGISILLANSTAEATRYWRNYVNGRLDTLLPALKNNDLRKIMLNLFASGLCRNEEEARTFLLSSYTGYIHWNSSPHLIEAFSKVISRNCSYLQGHGLLNTHRDGSLSTTKTGSLCAASGVEVESFVLLQEALQRIDTSNWEFWEIAFPCLHCRELSDLIRIYIRVVNNYEMWRTLEELNPRNREALCDWSLGLLKSSDDMAKRVQSFLILNDWINGTEMREIENGYTPRGANQVLSGTVRSIAEISSWMIQTLCRIARALDYDPSFIEAVQTLSEQVARGVPAEGLKLHKLGVRGVTRTTVRRLVEAGYHSLDQLLDTPAGTFRGIISPRIAQRIHEAITQELQESQERAKHIQAHRLEKQGLDPQIIRAIYETDGIPLEQAIVELLNTHPLELCAERIPSQRQGDPDILLPLPEGLLVGSVTASVTNISSRKCAEILSSGARMNPTAFAVFGRPGFHDLAIQNAPHLNNQLEPSKSYKLIPIQQLGELFVCVIEGKLTRDQFIDALLNKRGLVKAELI
jgi:helicase